MRATMPVSYCYILRRADPDTRMPWYKIGVSINPYTRAKKCHARVLLYEAGGYRRERELHSQFAHLRQYRGDFEGRTEWFFDDEGEIAAYVNDRLDAE